jgi:hypothetical protein
VAGCHVAAHHSRPSGLKAGQLKQAHGLKAQGLWITTAAAAAAVSARQSEQVRTIPTPDRKSCRMCRLQLLLLKARQLHACVGICCVVPFIQRGASWHTCSKQQQVCIHTAIRMCGVPIPSPVQTPWLRCRLPASGGVPGRLMAGAPAGPAAEAAGRGAAGSSGSGHTPPAGGGDNKQQYRRSSSSSSSRSSRNIGGCRSEMMLGCSSECS